MSSTDNRLGLSGKTKISEFNDYEARGWVIDSFTEIEGIIDDIITAYFQPIIEWKFKKFVLNSSIISIGGKLKILGGCEILERSEIEQIRELSAIRNGFAHSDLKQTLDLLIGEGEERPSAIDAYNAIDVMNSAGKVTTKKAHEYLIEFSNIVEIVKPKLTERRKSLASK